MAQTFVTLEIPEESTTTSCFCNGFETRFKLENAVNKRNLALSIIPDAATLGLNCLFSFTFVISRISNTLFYFRG
jgi:hypothetical protein